MKKVLLLCLTALMCCVTGAWAVTGSGTESDPYVVQDGDEYTVTGGVGYAEFSAPESGVLKVFQDYFLGLDVSIKEKGSADDFVVGQFSSDQSGMYTSFDVEGGKTYIIKNAKDAMSWGTKFSIVFEGDSSNPNAFTVTSDPAEGSALGHYDEGEVALKFTTSKPIAYMRVIIDGSVNGRMTDVPATPVGEGTPVLGDDGEPVVFVDRNDPTNTYELKAYTEWTVGPSFIKEGMTNDWDFYENEDYTFTFTSYEDQNAWYDYTELYSTELTFKGSVPAIEYSDIVLENVTPSPDATDPSQMASSENPVVRFTFSGLVKPTEVGSVIGQGMGIVPLDYEEGVEGDKSYIDVTLEGGSNSAYITVYVEVVDSLTGNALNDETGLYSQYFSVANSAYTIDMPWADGRSIDYLLNYENLNPKDNGYVTALDSITFDCTDAADPDEFYTINAMGHAGVYNEAGEQIYDVLLTKGAAEQNVIATVCELGSVNQETQEGTPFAITTPGVYVVKVDSMSIGDGLFDPNTPWQTDQGGFTKGRCNPTWTWTFNVVEEIVTVESVDPAPYNVSGEYCEEIPAEVKLTMNSADYTVASATARYGMNTREALEYTADGNVLTVKLSDAALNESQVTITVAATANKGGAPVVYGSVDDETQNITLVYQKNRNTFVPETVTPEDRSYVETLEEVVLDFGEDVSALDWDKVVTLTNAEGEEFECSYDMDWEVFSRVHIFMADPIAADGVYTLTIPEGFIFNMTYDFGFVDQYGGPQGDFYNPELTYVFYIGDPTGIKGIKVDADGNVKVYTIDGVYVGEGAAAEMLESLPAGVYIVNGTKVAVK